MYQTALRELASDENLDLPEPKGFGSWSLDSQLLASVVDLLAIIKWQNENQGVDRSKQSAFPEPVARPGVKKRKPSLSLVTMQQMQARRDERNRIIAAQEQQDNESVS